MKEMKPEQVRRAMIEIIIGKKPSRLKVDYPEHYLKIRNEIADIHSSGRMATIPRV